MTSQHSSHDTVERRRPKDINLTQPSPMLSTPLLDDEMDKSYDSLDNGLTSPLRLTRDDVLASLGYKADRLQHKSSLQPTSGTSGTPQSKYGTGKMCYRCGKAVYPVEKVDIGVLYHRGCFKCLVCGVQLSVSSFHKDTLAGQHKEVYCKTHIPKQAPTHFGQDAIGIQAALAAQKTASEKIYKPYEQSPYKYESEALEFVHARELKQRKKVRRRSSLRTYKDFEKFGVFEAQEAMERKHRQEEDELYLQMREERQRQLASIEKDIASEKQRTVKELVAWFEEQGTSKEETEDGLRKVEMHYKQQREERIKKLLKRISVEEKSAVDRMIEKHAQEMLVLIEEKEKEAEDYMQAGDQQMATPSRGHFLVQPDNTRSQRQGSENDDDDDDDDNSKDDDASRDDDDDDGDDRAAQDDEHHKVDTSDESNVEEEDDVTQRVKDDQQVQDDDDDNENKSHGDDISDDDIGNDAGQKAAQYVEFVEKKREWENDEEWSLILSDDPVKDATQNTVVVSETPTKLPVTKLKTVPCEVREKKKSKEERMQTYDSNEEESSGTDEEETHEQTGPRPRPRSQRSTANKSTTTDKERHRHKDKQTDDRTGKTRPANEVVPYKTRPTDVATNNKSRPGSTAGRNSRADVSTGSNQHARMTQATGPSFQIIISTERIGTRYGDEDDDDVNRRNESLEAKRRRARRKNEDDDDDDDHGTLMSRQPAAQPPQCRKSKLYKSADIFKDFDRRAVEEAKRDPTSFTDLVRRLSKKCTTELQRVRAIFRWITAKDLNQMEFTEKLDADTPMGLLRGIKFGTESYHNLFKRLCSYAGLHCKVVEGYSKGAGYRPGSQLKGSRFRNQWTAVYLDGSWRFINCNWGARHVTAAKVSKMTYKIDEFYFLTDPEEHIYQHFPDDPRWQLLRRPISMDEFVQLPLVKSPFFNNKLSFTVRPTAALRTIDGVVELRLKMPSLKNFAAVLRSKDRSVPDELLADRCLIRTIDNQAVLYASLPSPGRYYWDVFVDSEWSSGSMDNACGFLVHCPKVTANAGVSFPQVGCFGRTPQSARYGIASETDGDPLVVCTGELVVAFRVPVELEAKLTHTLRYWNQRDRLLLDCDKFSFMKSRIGTTVTYLIHCPRKGNYVFSLNVAEPHGESAPCKTSTPSGSPDTKTTEKSDPPTKKKKVPTATLR